MEWEPDEQHLGDLGVAGIRRETLRVVRAILPSFACHVPNIFIFLAHVAGCVTVFSHLVSGDLSRLLDLFFSPAFFYFFCDFAVMDGYNMAFVLSVASFYRNKGADRAGPMAIPHLRRHTNRDERNRHCATFLLAVTAFGGYTAVFGSAWLTLRLLDAPGEIVLPLQLLGGAACLAGAVYLVVVLRVACVVSLLENASGFGAMLRSRALLDGNFRAAATVFAVLDGCFVAVLMAFPTVTLEDAMGGMGLGQFAAVATMTAMLCVVVVVTLVAQPVVYLVCKNYHQNRRTLPEV